MVSAVKFPQSTVGDRVVDLHAVKCPVRMTTNNLLRPAIRQRLFNATHIHFDDFFIPCCSLLCVNWPYSEAQVLISANNPEDPSEVKMNPVFESHIRDLRNWSLGPTFQATYPELVDASVRIEGGSPMK